MNEKAGRENTRPPVAGCKRGLPAGFGLPGRPWLAAGLILAGRAAFGQEALRYSLAGEAAAQSRRLSPDSMPFTWKAGDFRLLMTPSISLEWNDNVRINQDNPQEDFIVRPVLGLAVSYPITQRNLLTLNVDVGYSKYLEHDELSTWYVSSGSALSFDVFVKDFLINLHDRFSYVQNSSQEAAVANTGTYGTFNNTAGLSTTWDLQDVTLTLGYDHQNMMSTSGGFRQTDHTSELFVARAGLRVHPKLTLGVEGTTSLTSYDQQQLNNSIDYSGGVYGEWRPGHYFTVAPRFGYTIYSFEQTSDIPGVQASDQDAWYADFTVTHQPTEVLSYSLSAGHEIRLGIQSDAIEDYYLRPSATWSIFKNVSFSTSAFYEHGTQAGGRLPGFPAENYDWYRGRARLRLFTFQESSSRTQLSIDYAGLRCRVSRLRSKRCDAHRFLHPPMKTTEIQDSRSDWNGTRFAGNSCAIARLPGGAVVTGAFAVFLLLTAAVGALAENDARFSDVSTLLGNTNQAVARTSDVTASDTATNVPVPSATGTNATGAAFINSMEDLDDKHKLAIGDQLSFRIVEDEEDPKRLFVTDSGDLEVPYVGRFPAERKTCKELARELKKALEKDYYYQATVIIAVDVMAKSRGRVYLVGPVKMAGPQEIPSDEVFTLRKAILRAGGFGDFADKHNVRVTRKGRGPGGQDKTIIVDVAQILEKGKTEADMVLEPGDFIYIPEKSIRF